MSLVDMTPRGLTDQQATILEAHWQSMTAYKYAQISGEDPMVVAAIMDTFDSEGW